MFSMHMSNASCTLTILKLYTEVKFTDDVFRFQDCLDSLHQWSHAWHVLFPATSVVVCCSIDIGKHAVLDDARQCCLVTEFIGMPEYVSDLGIAIEQ